MADLVTVDVDVINQTTLSYFVSDGDREVWVPMSLISNDDPIEDGHIEIPEWFAIQEGLV